MHCARGKAGTWETSESRVGPKTKRMLGVSCVELQRGRPEGGRTAIGPLWGATRFSECRCGHRRACIALCLEHRVFDLFGRQQGQFFRHSSFA